jgi:uncharacterized membrane protein HdeD (DUF308 family)
MEEIKNELSRKIDTLLWKLILYRGIVLILAGIILTFFAKATLATIVFIMGLYWLADGILTTYNAVRGRKFYSEWKWGLITGILGILAGLVVIFHPNLTAVLTATFIAWFLGLAALVYGIFGLVTGIKLSKTTQGHSNMIWGGLLSIFFGIMLIASPYFSTIALLNTIGILALTGGIILVAVAYSVKKKTANQ